MGSASENLNTAQHGFIEANFAAAIDGILGEINSPGRDVYPQLLHILQNHFFQLCAANRARRKRYFPISLLRESVRQYLLQSDLLPQHRLLFYTAVSDALLTVMAADLSLDVSQTGKSLLTLLSASNSPKALLLRLHYVVGLNWDEIEQLPEARERISDPVQLALELADDLKTANLSHDALQKQNLEPKGDITAGLQAVRDGQNSLDEFVAGQQPHLRRQAAYLLSRERGKSSLQVTDLVDELFLRLPRESAKAPLNHKELEALIKLLMRHILADRFRKKIPGQPKLSTELPPTLPALAEPLDQQLYFDKVLEVTRDVILELRRSDPETAEILTAVVFRSANQKKLAHLHAISLAQLKRRLKGGRDMIRERLGLE